MMNFECSDIKALLSGLVDDELDQETKHQAERHLADCKPCRDIVNQAESMNNLVALEMQRQMWPVGLPAGFEDSVLNQTIYAEAYQFAGRRWTSWLGWVAAAACLMLSVSLWFLRAPGANMSRNLTPAPSPAVQPQTYAQSARSWVFDGAFPADANILRANLSEETYRAIDHELANLLPGANAEALIGLTRGQAINREDAETLYATSNLLDTLNRADLSSFADVERIRQIAVYDDLLPRLAKVRANLSPAERPVVLAAESVLLRVVNGPLDLQDLRELHDTVAALDLSSEVGAISNRWQPASSL